MATKLMYYWTIVYYFEPNGNLKPLNLPHQVKAETFDNAKMKVQAYLDANYEKSMGIKINGLTQAGVACLE